MEVMKNTVAAPAVGMDMIVENVLLIPLTLTLMEVGAGGATAGTVVRSCPERLRFSAGQCVAGDGNAKLASKGEPRRCKAFR